MTTEDDFQAALDVDPTDWQTRLVFADWLDERDDPRAEGYRAIGTLRLCPAWVDHTATVRFDVDAEVGRCPFWERPGTSDPALIIVANRVLPVARFDVITRWNPAWAYDACAPAWHRRNDMTRRELEDAAAVAFAALDEGDKREILAAAVTHEAKGRAVSNHVPTKMVYSHRSSQTHAHVTRHGSQFRNHWYKVYKCPVCNRQSSHKRQPIICKGRRL